MSCSDDVQRFLKHEISTGKLLELHNARDVVGCFANLHDAMSEDAKRLPELRRSATWLVNELRRKAPADIHMLASVYDLEAALGIDHDKAALAAGGKDL